MRRDTAAQRAARRSGAGSMGVMLSVLSALLAFSAVAPAENLLSNPGFEELKGGQAAGWNLYVMPQTGSWGRLDDEAPLNGKYSACLHIATPYIVDPLNNWSQNILKDLRGSELVLRGSIKTEDATEAAIWLQCFRKSPLSTLDAATTSDRTPMRGTHDWTPVELKLKVPLGTEFIVCRCVLKGSGTAWFDNLSVEKVTPETDMAASKDAVAPAAQPTAVAAPSPVAKSAARPPLSAPTSIGKQSPSGKPKLKSTDKAAAPGDGQKTYQELLDANRELTKSNQEMQEQIKRLSSEVQSLRRLVQQSAQMGGMGMVPPLIPHGLTTEDGF